MNDQKWQPLPTTRTQTTGYLYLCVTSSNLVQSSQVVFHVLKLLRTTPRPKVKK